MTKKKSANVIDLTRLKSKKKFSSKSGRQRKASIRWTIEEDLLLLEAIKKVGSPSNWASIASTVGTKNAGLLCKIFAPNNPPTNNRPM